MSTAACSGTNGKITQPRSHGITLPRAGTGKERMCRPTPVPIHLHLVDAVDTAEAEGMEPRTAGFSLSAIFASKSTDVFRETAFAPLIERWTPLAIGMNSLSRSMGHADFYPFVIPPPVVEKLAFVHRVIRATT
jgi:hypothetical protein